MQTHWLVSPFCFSLLFGSALLTVFISSMFYIVAQNFTCDSVLIPAGEVMEEARL